MPAPDSPSQRPPLTPREFHWLWYFAAIRREGVRYAALEEGPLLSLRLGFVADARALGPGAPGGAVFRCLGRAGSLRP